MTMTRRSLLATVGLTSTLLACGSPGTPTPNEDTMAPDPPGELASPSTAPFPDGYHLVFEDGLLHAVTFTHLLSWTPDGDLTRQVALEELNAEGPGSWDLHDGVFALGGADQYSCLIARPSDGAVLGTAQVPNPVEPASGDTVTPSAFLSPREVATDATFVAAAFGGGTVLVFDLAGNQLHEVAPVGFELVSDGDYVFLDHAPDGALVLYSERNACPVQFWQPDGSSVIAVVEDGPPNPRHVSFGDTTFVVLDEADGQSHWSLFDTSTRQLIDEGTFPETTHRVALTPDGTAIASTGPSGSLQLTDVATGASTELSAVGYPLQSLLFSPDGGTLFSLHEAVGVRAWDVASGEGTEFPLPM